MLFDPVRARPQDLRWPIKVGRRSTAPTWAVANGPGYQRVGCGSYVELPRSAAVEQRIIEAAAPLAASDPAQAKGCVTGWAGLCWHGAAYFDGGGPHGGDTLPVELNIPVSNMRGHPGILVTQRGMGFRELLIVDGLPVATIQRCLFDEIRRRNDLWLAVTAIDMAAAAGLISAWLFATYVGNRNSLSGAPLAREAVSLAVDESRSPRECWCRLCWMLVAGLPEPLVNHALYSTDGTFLAIPDLFDPMSGTAVEYQGVHHKGIKQHRDDVKRNDFLRDHGVEVVEIVRGDSRGQAADRMLRGRRRALEIPDSRRDWTITPPPGTVRIPTLDEHLAQLGRVESLTHH